MESYMQLLEKYHLTRDKIFDNAKELLDTHYQVKPSAAKGAYIKSILSAVAQ